MKNQKVFITEQEEAAQYLGCTVAQIEAFAEAEDSNSDWFKAGHVKIL